MIIRSHDGAGVGGVLLADDPVAAARVGLLRRVAGDVLRRRRRRRRRRLRRLPAGAAVAAAVAMVAAAVGRPRRERVGVGPGVRDLDDLGRRRAWLLLGRRRRRRLFLRRLGLRLGRRRRWLHDNHRRRRLGLLLLLRRRWLGLFFLGWLRLRLRRRRRRRRREVDDLDLLDDLARLAAELVCELVRVEGPRHDHLVVLHVELDVVDDELTLVSDPGEHPVDLGIAALAFQVHFDDDGPLHLDSVGSRLQCEEEEELRTSARRWSEW